jgi:hypothetical protein
MFNAPYPFCSLGKSDTNEKNPYKRMHYKFYAKHRTYLVTLEFYSFHLVAIKYCDVKDKHSRKAYSKIFNDDDAFRVIGTCFHIMYKYWRSNKNVNFVFYASLRDIAHELLIKKSIEPEKVPEFLEKYKRARYSIYRYGMVNLFSYEYFTPITDKKNCIYVLINKNHPKASDIIDPLTDYLLKNHDIIFDPE